MDVFTNSTFLHAMIVHFPVALAVLGIPLVYASAVVRSDKNEIRWIAFFAYAVLAVFAFMAARTGQRAIEKLPSDWPQAVWDLANRHEEMGEKVWVFGLVTAVLIAASTVRFRMARNTAVGLAMVASLITGAWVGLTGHYGGTLVYLHGAGTPAMHMAAAAPQPAVKPALIATAQPGTMPQAAPTPQPAAADAATAVPATKPFTPEEAKQVSYVKQVKPILENDCVECHKPEKAKSDLDLTTVATMLTGGKKAGPSIIAGQPDASPIVEYIRGIKRPQMPKGEDPLSVDDLHVIRMWIAAGAIDDSAPKAEAPAATPAAPTPVPAAPAPAAPAPAAPAPTPAAPSKPALVTPPAAPAATAPAA